MAQIEIQLVASRIVVVGLQPVIPGKYGRSHLGRTWDPTELLARPDGSAKPPTGPTSQVTSNRIPLGAGPSCTC